MSTSLHPDAGRAASPSARSLFVAYMPGAGDGPWFLLREDSAVVDHRDGSPIYRVVSAHGSRACAEDARTEQLLMPAEG